MLWGCFLWLSCFAISLLRLCTAVLLFVCFAAWVGCFALCDFAVSYVVRLWVWVCWVCGFRFVDLGSASYLPLFGWVLVGV